MSINIGLVPRGWYCNSIRIRVMRSTCPRLHVKSVCRPQSSVRRSKQENASEGTGLEKLSWGNALPLAARRASQLRGDLCRAMSGPSASIRSKACKSSWHSLRLKDSACSASTIMLRRRRRTISKTQNHDNVDSDFAQTVIKRRDSAIRTTNM